MLANANASFFIGLLALSSTAAAAGGAVLKRDGSAPTATTTPGATSTTCDNPNQTTGYPDYSSFCQCPPYTADSPAFGNPYLGLVKCDTTCTPANATQTLDHPETGSLSDCINACTGSYEKAKRDGLESRQDDGYWYCHGVNFIQGQLCQFIGELGTREFNEQGPDCWYLDD
ncbi:uncharacterized protein F4822DRAFT_1297 [Hypoxylon trugodes]|uniref:uncharacterized protein n=1 Tax=Hypoxylon trugodes TaxID=326681 RepID=UPI00218DDF92|nr:uncharacterized protein F4822DRAFT_1297 [Hypoxylon trugodes]KAI1393137.1 hypothetical protein F4822DRAFT_1297 [Hypoxylon trugodes]